MLFVGCLTSQQHASVSRHRDDSILARYLPTYPHLTKAHRHRDDSILARYLPVYPHLTQVRRHRDDSILARYFFTNIPHLTQVRRHRDDSILARYLPIYPHMTQVRRHRNDYTGETFTNIPQPRWPSGKASASRAEDPGFESRLRRDFFGVESYQ